MTEGAAAAGGTAQGGSSGGLGAGVRVRLEDGDRTDKGIGTGIAAPELAVAQLCTPEASVPRPVEVDSTVSPTLGHNYPFAGV
jgi:hypothetical protein